MVVRRYVPPSCSTRESLFGLSSSNKHRFRVIEIPEDQRREEERQSTASSPSLRSRTAVSRSDSLDFTLDSEKDRDRDSTTLLNPPPKSKPAASFYIGVGSGGSQEDVSTAHPSESAGTADTHTVTKDSPDNELFPMGYCGETKYESGWLDYACGPSISLLITYYSHNHDVQPSDYSKKKPNALHVDIDAPIVLFRVYGCFLRDLLALKVSWCARI